MSESKEIVRKFFDTMCSGDFEGGFAGMTVDATWSVIGTTGVSGTLDKAGMLSKQLPMLASFKEPPVIGIDEMIAEGDRVVVLAHCKGVGPTGPYEQKRYSFVVRVRGGLVAEVVEYLETVAVETGICGNKIAPRNAGRLAGKVAIITGGGSGIGAAHARIFAAEGARVVVTDIVERAGMMVTDGIIAAGGDAIFLHHDVASEGSWKSVVDAAVAHYGKLTTLVNNAGINQMRGVEEETMEGWRHLIGVDQTGVWLGMKTAMPHLRASGNGAIVNMSSTLGMMGTVTCIAFHGAKGAVRVMSKAAAIEYAERGVRVNSIYPGMTDTPQLDNMLPEEREMIRTSIPMKRIGRPEEIANVSLFLCSDEASYVTGAEVVIDGGLRPG